VIAPRECSFACRDGERHPGPRKGGVLRGAPSERGPRSVRRALAGIPSRAGGAPTTADVRRSPRRGTSSRMRNEAHAPGTGRAIDLVLGRRVLRSVLRPVRVNPHYARKRCKAFSWWGVRIGITVGQTRASGRNQHWGRTDGRSRLAACHRSREGEGVARQKRKEVEASVPARIQSPGSCSYVVFSCRSR